MAQKLFCFIHIWFFQVQYTDAVVCQHDTTANTDYSRGHESEEQKIMRSQKLYARFYWDSMQA